MISNRFFLNLIIETKIFYLNTSIYKITIIYYEIHFNLFQEFGHPYLLLKNKKGILHGMVLQTGKNMADNLKKISKEVFIFYNLQISILYYLFFPI